jgi:outer membrane protein assembly factor BamB
VDDPSVSDRSDAVAVEPRANTRSDEALDRYRHQLRGQRLRYFGIVGAIVVALVVVVSVAWSRGEVAHTTLHTVAKAPADLAVTTPSPKPQLAWRTSDQVAIGTPQFEGTIVTYSAHTVRGVDARTGATTWSYSRSDRTICTVAQAGGTTMALYEIGGNCDEMTALESDTGQRRWTRTLDFDGQPLNGYPTYSVISYTFMITTPSVIYAIDPGTGYNRWIYSHFGCSITGGVLGSTGALISENCSKPRCAGLKYCRRGPQLFLRDGMNGRNDKSTTNPDLIKWDDYGNSDIPVSVDALVSGLNPTTHALDLFDSGNGKPQGTVSLAPVPDATAAVHAESAAGRELISIGDDSYVVEPSAEAALWSLTATGPATIIANDPDAPSPVLSTARITVPSATGVRQIDGNSGRTAQTFTLPRPPDGSLVYPLGTGFLIASSTGTAAYR